MHDGDDHRYLHLQAVDVVEVVGGYRPYRVQPDRIHAFSADSVNGGVLGSLVGQAVTGAEEIQADGHEVIVDEAAVGGEKAHQGQQIPMGQQHLQD